MKAFRFMILCSLLFQACSWTAEEYRDTVPGMFPDYSGTMVPRSIAPLNFRLTGGQESRLLLEGGDLSLMVKGPDFDIPQNEWRRMLETADSVRMTVLLKENGRVISCKPFCIHVSNDPIDGYIAYRLIEPAYETWNEMGLYQRDLSSFEQTAIISNSSTGGNCMNCHSFSNRDPGKMVFHMRANNGGTYIIDGDSVLKFNTKTPGTISAVVYPQWSADARFIAFSNNDIFQVFHSSNRNRIEVYDAASDVVIYDVKANELVSCPALMQEDVLETYPTFSPDGRTIYFCSSPRQDVPEGYRGIRYSICSIAFDPGTRSFGEKVDTLYNAFRTGKNAVFPRVSPDGRYLMYTESDYGCFSIWHKESELCWIDLETGKSRLLEELNSPDVDSYHSWSSNGRWVVFSSRRIDGLYTRPYIAHINEDGEISKPFLLPQRNPSFYHDFMKSYNIPEFVSGRVAVSEGEISECAMKSGGTDFKFKSR